MQFSENSRVWIYQSDKELNDEQAVRVATLLNNFATQWTAHNHQLKAKAEVRYNRFLVLIVDETQAGASGCSIDKSANFMKALEQTTDFEQLQQQVSLVPLCEALLSSALSGRSPVGTGASGSAAGASMPL